MSVNSQNGATTSTAVAAAQARLAAANAQAAQTPVIRTGETVTSTAAGLKGKVYYHRVPGARTHMPDGLEIVFLGGMFATEDETIIAELDKIADKASSGIFTNSAIAENLLSQERKAAAEAADTAGLLPAN